MKPEESNALLAPFPKSQIQQLPKGGIRLDYVSHGNVTRRLLEVDPEWNWKPLGLDEHGLPLFDERGGLWIELTVCGVTRIGYGEPQGSDAFDRIKGAIGNAIRVGAMRFGVALDLWAKDMEHHDHNIPVEAAKDYQPAPKRAINGQPLPVPSMSKKQSDLILKMVGSNVHLIDEFKVEKGITTTLNVAQASELIEWLKVTTPLILDPWAKDIPKGGYDD
jgi:hypothetical protein